MNFSILKVAYNPKLSSETIALIKRELNPSSFDEGGNTGQYPVEDVIKLIDDSVLLTPLDNEIIEELGIQNIDYIEI